LEKLEDCISFLVGKAAQQISRRSKEMLSAFGVTPVQYAVLKALWDDDGQSGQSIGHRLKLDGATITGIVDRLEREGLLERRSDRDDRRVHRIFLTRSGRSLREPLDQAMDELNENADRVLGRQAGAHRAALRRLGNHDMWGETDV
jgi:MarR family transcriptional regulator, organic hydroperoxide resistance regulator